MSKKLTNCKACGKEISVGAKCPNCGHDNRIWFAKHKVLSVLGVIVLLGALGSATGNKDNKQTTNTNTQTEQKQEARKQEVKKQEKKEEPKVPSEYKSALNKAKIYSDSMSMSKIGIYNQLTSEHGEKFSKEAAQYAINNLKADYKNNALKKAKTYQDKMSMSPSAIHDQLVSEYGEQFTEEEAKYAVDNLK